MNIIIQSLNREVVKKSKHLNYRHPPKLLYVNAPSSLNSAQLHLEVEFKRLMGSNMSVDMMRMEVIWLMRSLITAIRCFGQFNLSPNFKYATLILPNDINPSLNLASQAWTKQIHFELELDYARQGRSQWGMTLQFLFLFLNSLYFF